MTLCKLLCTIKIILVYFFLTLDYCYLFFVYCQVLLLCKFPNTQEIFKSVQFSNCYPFVCGICQSTYFLLLQLAEFSVALWLISCSGLSLCPTVQHMNNNYSISRQLYCCFLYPLWVNFFWSVFFITSKHGQINQEIKHYLPID